MVDIGLSRTKSADALVLTVRPIVRIYATHGVSRVEWVHYRHPLPENVFDIHMRYWSDVEFSPEKHFL